MIHQYCFFNFIIFIYLYSFVLTILCRTYHVYVQSKKKHFLWSSFGKTYIVVKTKLPNRLPNPHTCWSLNLPIGSRFSEPYFFLGTILNPTDTTTTRHDWWMLVILGYVKVPQMAKMVQLGMKKFNVLFNLHMQN